MDVYPDEANYKKLHRMGELLQVNALEKNTFVVSVFVRSAKFLCCLSLALDTSWSAHGLGSVMFCLG